tara:strand:+ start:183 stop:545 length:363 start_codon:yes stop_codon:yes gene_type:complete
VACKNPKNRPGGTPWNKGMKGRQDWHNTEGLKLGHGWWTGKKRPDHSKRMKEDNPIHKWAKRDPEGFRKEQSRKCVISNKKHPRGGWIGGYPGLTTKDKDWVEIEGGVFLAKELKEHLGL